MKKLLAVFLVLALLLAGCAGTQEDIDDTAHRADAQELLGAFLDRDYETCRMIVRQEVSDEDLSGIFDAICTELEDLGAYEMTMVAWERKTVEGHDLTTVQYLVEGENGKFYLDLSREADVPGIAGFRVTEAAADAEPTMPMGPVHWVFIAIGAAIIVFVMWMLVDCARRNMKRKWLWMPLILLGTLILTLTMRQGNVNFGFRIGLLLGMTNLTTFVRGGFRVMLYVPLGAIVYFFKRRELSETRPEDTAQAEGDHVDNA